ncbi:MAG: hypothetical protein CMJ89_14900 [Planctomycetes bacterium]|nr:hypothetical protein [Planctomycetota bacterium]
MKIPFLTALAFLPLGASCFHTLESRREPSREQKLDLYTTTATYLYEDGDLERAQQQAVKALEIDPDHRTMRRMIGWIRLRLGSNEDVIYAEDFFNRLIEDGDDSPATVLGLAIAYERLGNAYDVLGRAIEADRHMPEKGVEVEDSAADKRATAERYWNKAIVLLEGLLRNGEGNTDAMNALQRVYAALERFDESLAWSEKLLERSEAELETWQRMLTSEHLTDEEEEFFRNNQESAHRLRTQTHLFAATLLFKHRRHRDALLHLDAVVAGSPNLPEAYSIRGQLLFRLGEFQRAMDDLDRFLSLSEASNEHPDILRAFDMRNRCEQELASTRRRG